MMIVMEFVGGGDLLEQVMTRHGLRESSFVLCIESAAQSLSNS